MVKGNINLKRKNRKIFSTLFFYCPPPFLNLRKRKFFCFFSLKANLNGKIFKKDLKIFLEPYLFLPASAGGGDGGATEIKSIFNFDFSIYEVIEFFKTLGYFDYLSLIFSIFMLYCKYV